MFDVSTGLESLGSGFFPFLVYLVLGLALTGGFAALYAAITPHEELKLIRENQAGAAISMSGALIGFAIPMASIIAQAVTVFDFVFWGVVAGLAQLAAFWAFRLVFPKISGRIEGGEVAAPTVLAATHIVIGLINAASLVY